jgi:hypothetical protein
MILERFAPVDEDYRNFLMKPRVRGPVFEDIDFSQVEGLLGPQFLELCFDRIAQAASGLGEEDNVDHRDLKRF